MSITDGQTRPDLSGIQRMLEAIEGNVATIISGKPEVIRLSIVTLLAQGHLLIEDVPGVGKTLLARALARSLDCTVSRIQFTPDLLPSDVTGITVYSPDRGVFTFRPGSVFANIVLGDEINRAGPKTQSALLEAMEERTVTIDGATHELARPFMVIATQNPIELEGTYPLPEAQRDRFMMRLSIGYPHHDHELEILRNHGRGDPLAELAPVCATDEVNDAIAHLEALHVAPSLERYIIALCRATRHHPQVELGASPRAALALLRASRAHAGLEGRDYVVPDDIKTLTPHVLAHRLILTPDAELAGRVAQDVIEDVLAGVPTPTD